MLSKVLNPECGKLLIYGLKGVGLIGVISSASAFTNRLLRESVTQFSQTITAQAVNVREAFRS